MTMLKIKSNKAFLNFFCIIKYFFCQGFLLRTLTNHRMPVEMERIMLTL